MYNAAEETLCSSAMLSQVSDPVVSMVLFDKQNGSGLGGSAGVGKHGMSVEPFIPHFA